MQWYWTQQRALKDYSLSEVEQANEARLFQRQLGDPSITDIIAEIKSGAILNVSVTVTDFHNAEAM